MNEQLLAATLKVLMNSQATLYAHIMKLQYETDVWHLTAADIKGYMDEYLEDTAKLIIEAYEAAGSDVGMEAESEA